MRFKLVEAYSESMPQIIKDWLTKNKYYKQDLMNRGIDPATAVFHHYPTPTSNRDPIFKHDDTKEIFFTFPNTHPDYIYVKDMNDDYESFMPDPNGRYMSSRKKWRYLGAKTLIDAGADIWYVDKTETGENSRLKPLKDMRNKYRSEIEHDPNRRFTPKEVRDMSGSNRNPITGAWGSRYNVFDKSGYLIDPDKYIRKLANSPNYRPDKAQIAKIQKLYDDILATNARIVNAYSSVEDSDIMTYRPRARRGFEDALGEIDEAISSYNNAMSTLKDLTNYLDSTQGKTRNLDDIKRRENNIQYYIDKAVGRCNDAKKYMADWVTAIIDWDTEDYVDDGI